MRNTGLCHHTCFSIINGDGSLPRPATGQWSPSHCRNLII